jgi:cell migration-inducing and hyaluronan-binding protein
MTLSRPTSLAFAGLLALGAATALHAAFSPPERWSDPATWHGAPPAANATVTIPAGRTVLLDTAPPPLARLVVDGRLILADRDLRLDAREIVVRGELRAGDARRPFAHRLEIVLHPTATAAATLTAQDGGRIELWGRARRAWTHLARTAPPGTRELDLADPVDWHAGDRLALAPSGFDAREAEELTVARAGGTHVVLTAPLRFRHWGAVTDGVDERAEIGLLSHAIVVRSDAATARGGIGGQVVVMRGGTLRAQGVQFTGLGERGKLGRYPIHFHLAGDARGSFVTASSIEHSNNRCLTIHGTSGVVVRDDVAFDTIGHCYFLEDGVETGNLLEGNLGLLTRGAPPASAILESDAQPATFWIANPDNIVRGNAAAGSEGTGFWYSLAPHPTGPSANPAIWPRRTDLAEFSANAAHANEMNGLFVDILRNPPGVTEAPNYSPPDTADFRAFTSYKNRRRGAWLRGTNLRLSGAAIADNSIGVTFAGANAVLRDSLVVGETDNRTGPPKPFDARFPLRGFEFYDGRVGVETTRFAHFVPDRTRAASALSALEFSPFFTDPTNYARALAFDDALPVYLEPHAGRPRAGADGYRANVFRDLDGSVTGTPGSSVVLNAPLLADAVCTAHRDWNAAVCPARYGSLFVVDVDGGKHPAGPVRVSLAPAATILLYGNPTPGADKIFQTNVRAGRTYTVQFHRGFPSHVRLGLHDLAPGERVTIVLPQAPPGTRVRSRDAAAPAPQPREHGIAVDLIAGTSPSNGAVLDLHS